MVTPRLPPYSASAHSPAPRVKRTASVATERERPNCRRHRTWQGRAGLQGATTLFRRRARPVIPRQTRSRGGSRAAAENPWQRCIRCQADVSSQNQITLTCDCTAQSAPDYVPGMYQGQSTPGWTSCFILIYYVAISSIFTCRCKGRSSSPSRRSCPTIPLSLLSKCTLYQHLAIQAVQLSPLPIVNASTPSHLYFPWSSDPCIGPKMSAPAHVPPKS